MARESLKWLSFVIILEIILVNGSIPLLFWSDQLWSFYCLLLKVSLLVHLIMIWLGLLLVLKGCIDTLYGLNDFVENCEIIAYDSIAT